MRLRTSPALVFFLFFGVGVAAPALGQEPEASPATPVLEKFEALRAALAQRLISPLQELALEARKSRLYGEADLLHRTVIALDEDNVVSRRALRFHRVSATRWVQSQSYKAGRNHAEADAQPLRTRVGAVTAPYRETLLAEVERVREQAGPLVAWTASTMLSASLPEDEVLRARIGEVRSEHGWELVETAQARKRRKAFPSLAEACIELAPEPEVDLIRDFERALAVSWTSARKTPRVRVVGNTGDAEAELAARVSHAVGDLFRYTLVAEDEPREDLTIYLLSSAQKEAFLSSWPALSQRTRLALANADGGWLDAQNRLGEWGGTQQRRIDGAARQKLGTLLIDVYHIDGRQGWAWEGLGLYLVHQLVGTRLTWFFHPDGYAPQQPTMLWTALQTPGADWIAEAAGLVASERAPRLVYLLGRGVNDMRDEDVLYAYALAAYLLEGSPQATPAILRRIGAGEHPTTVFEEELGFPLPIIEARLARWLTEAR